MTADVVREAYATRLREIDPAGCASLEESGRLADILDRAVGDFDRGLASMVAANPDFDREVLAEVVLKKQVLPPLPEEVADE